MKSSISPGRGAASRRGRRRTCSLSHPCRCRSPWRVAISWPISANSRLDVCSIIEVDVARIGGITPWRRWPSCRDLQRHGPPVLSDGNRRGAVPRIPTRPGGRHPQPTRPRSRRSGSSMTLRRRIRNRHRVELGQRVRRCRKSRLRRKRIP